uniref:Transposase n=1 Tax=Brugia timori TaxID=42155 RepID=A0A0R3R6R6_9BILA
LFSFNRNWMEIISIRFDTILKQYLIFLNSFPST